MSTASTVNSVHQPSPEDNSQHPTMVVQSSLDKYLSSMPLFFHWQSGTWWLRWTRCRSFRPEVYIAQDMVQGTRWWPWSLIPLQRPRKLNQSKRKQKRHFFSLTIYPEINFCYGIQTFSVKICSWQNRVLFWSSDSVSPQKL